MKAILNLEPNELQSASQEVIAARLRPLRSLQIANHPDLTDQGLQQLLSHCPELETIELQNCIQIGDPTLRFLASSTRLRLLSWLGPSAASDKGFHFLFTHSPTLTSLNVSGTHFSTQACRTLLTKTPSLTALDLSFCPIDDYAFDEIKVPLQFLNLQGCTSITDAALFRLARATTLRHLFLGYNDQITLDGLRFLKTLPLQTLRISPYSQDARTS